MPTRSLTNSLTRSVTRGLSEIGAGGFSSTALFAGGATGSTVRFSDTSSMFQTQYGDVPVTATGQPVKLVLDKSRGLASGGQLLTNGDFSDGLTGWVVIDTAPGVTSVVGGAAQMAATGGTCRLRQSMAVTANRWYRVTFTLTGTVGGATAQLGSVSGGSDYAAIVPVVGQNTMFAFVTGTTLWLSFFKNTTGTITVDNIVVESIAGNHMQLPNGATYQVDGNGKAYIQLNGTDGYATFPGSAAAFKFLHDGTGGSVYVAAALTSPLTASKTYPIAASSTGAAASVGLYLAAAESVAGNINTQRALYAVNNGAAQVISATNNAPGSVRGDGIGQVFGCAYLTQTGGDFTSYLDGSSFGVSSAEAASPSTANAAFDLQIGRANGAVYSGMKLYGVTVVSEQLTASRRQQLVAEMRRLYADDGSILAVGDSHTFNTAYGIYMRSYYPARVEAALRSAGVRAPSLNYGISGDTTSGILARIGTVLEQGAATTLAVIYAGQNDGAIDTASNLTGIANQIKAAGCARVLICGAHYMNFATGGDTVSTQDASFAALRAKQQAAATAAGVPYVDLYAYMRDLIVAGTYTQGNDTAWHVAVGNTHLNATGEQILADAIYAAMQTQGWA